MRFFAPVWLRIALLSLAATPVVACKAETASDDVAEASPLPLTGRVVDAADILTPETERELTGRLAALERDTRAQFVVVSTPDLEGMSIADYALRLGRGWGIGDARRHDGVLLVVAPKEHKVRIEVGYGLESTLRFERCAKIIADDILPRFRQGDLSSGTMAGAAAIESLLRKQAEVST